MHFFFSLLHLLCRLFDTWYRGYGFVILICMLLITGDAEQRTIWLFVSCRSVVTLSSCHSFLGSEPHFQVDSLDLPEDTPWGQASFTALQSLWMVTALCLIQTWCYEKSPNKVAALSPTLPWYFQQADLSSPQGKPFSWVVNASGKCPKKEPRACN